MNEWWYCRLIRAEDNKFYMLKQTEKGWEVAHKITDILDYIPEDKEVVS